MDDLLQLTEGMPEIDLHPDDVLLEEGATTGRLFVLVHGSLVVRRGEDDFVHIATPGACVGEMALLLDRPHSATIVATSPTRVRVIDDATDALRDSPQLVLAIASLLASRLHLVNEYLGDLRRQYHDVDGGLGLIGAVLQDLAVHQGDAFEAGSDREPDPLY